MSKFSNFVKSRFSNEMSSIAACMSPLGWIFGSIAAIVPIIVILRPSFSELMIALFVDYLAFGINSIIEKPIFFYLFPETKFYYAGVNKEKFIELSVVEKKVILDSFFKFPLRRAFYFYIGSFIKTLPGMLIMIFVWERKVTLGSQIVTVLAIESVHFWHLYCSVFIESHIFISKLIKNLHEEFDLTQVFSQIKIKYSRFDFFFSELVGVIFLIVFSLVLQWMIIVTSVNDTSINIAVKTLVISLIAILLLCRLWYLNRGYFIGGLENIFQRMDSTDYKDLNHSLPLHSSPLLAKFENTFNQLNQRLISSEQELSSLIFSEVEKSRFRVLGEMSALIAHDLSSPLHVARFCVSQLEENPSVILRDKRYLRQLELNLDQAIGLTNSLRARIKNSEVSPTSVTLKDAHHHVLRLLSTQFLSKDFNRVKISLDRNLENIKLKIQRIDLIHILDNIYKNSFQNLTSNSIVGAFLNIRLFRLYDDSIEILIEDNGTGLSSERFEKLTAFLLVRTKDMSYREGLGLRLTRRLVELNHGSLSISEGNQKSGTVFKLILPLDRTTEITPSEIVIERECEILRDGMGDPALKEWV